MVTYRECVGKARANSLTEVTSVSGRLPGGNGNASERRVVAAKVVAFWQQVFLFLGKNLFCCGALNWEAAFFLQDDHVETGESRKWSPIGHPVNGHLWTQFRIP